MRDRLGVYTNCYGPAGIVAAAALARDAGLDRIELALRPHDHGGLVIPGSAVLDEGSTDAQLAAFRDLLGRFDVTVGGCNIGGANLLTIAGLDVTLRRLRVAKSWFDASVVVCNAGQPVDLDERRILLAHLGRLGDEAARLAMVVAFETHAGPTVNADAMLALMADLDHPALRLNFDTGNIAYYNRGLNPVDELRRVVPYVANVHLKDHRGGYENWDFPALGAGDINFREIFNVLETAGYPGPLTIEIEGVGGEPEPGLLLRHIRVMDSVRYSDSLIEG